VRLAVLSANNLGRIPGIKTLRIWAFETRAVLSAYCDLLWIVAREEVSGVEFLQSALEVVGEVLLTGVLILLVCAAACVLATPFILIRAALDRERFWPSVRRRYESVLRGAARVADRLL